MKYDRILELVMAAMEDETSWRKTWQSQSCLHQNWVSKRPYNGTNQLMTMISSWMRGFEKPYWLTYKQVVELGGSVKGQKATPAIFFGTGKDKEDTEKSYKFAKLYNIFNIEQTGIELPQVELRQAKLERPYEMADAIKVKISSSTFHNPCYSPSADEIQIALVSAYESHQRMVSSMDCGMCWS